MESNEGDKPLTPPGSPQASAAGMQNIDYETENDKKEDIFSNQELNNSNKKQKELELQQ